MTVSNSNYKIQYSGNGTTTAFATNFRILDQTHVLVTELVVATGVESTATITTDYTVTVGATTATINYLVAPPTGTRITLTRNVPESQLTDYVSNDAFPAETHEAALDKLTMIAQQIDEKIVRSVKAPISDSSSTLDMELPQAADRANKIFAFDSDGNPTTATQDPGSANAAGIDWTDAYGNTNTIEHKLRQVVSVKDFGAVGDGVDDLTAVQAAIASGAKALYFPAGTYNLPSASTMMTLSDITLYGDGIQKTFIQCTPSASVVPCILIAGDDVKISDMTIVGNALTSISVLVGFSTTVDTTRHTFTNVEFDGTPSNYSTYSYHCQGIRPSVNKAVTEVRFTNCLIHNFGYGVYTDNTLAVEHTDWFFTNCSFYANRADDVELNSNNSAVPTWGKVVFTGCNFYGWAGDPGSTSAGFAIGTDSGREIIVQGCHFKDYTYHAIHIEDMTERIIIKGNIFLNCRVAVSIYELESLCVIVQGNVIDGTLTTDIGDDPSTYGTPPGSVDAACVGIYMQTPGVSSSSSLVNIQGNTITRCDFGISAPIDRGGEVINNIIGNCNVGIRAPSSLLSRIRNNRIVKCQYVFSGANLIAGKNTMEDCTYLIYQNTGLLHFGEGFRWCKSLAVVDGNGTGVAPGVVTNFIIHDEIPSRITASLISFACRQVGANSILTSSQIEYDGTTFTGAKVHQVLTGPCSMSDAGLIFDGTDLVVAIYSELSPDTDWYIDMDVSGVWMWG